MSDNVYCHEVAKRAVARAALHLGLDAMSEEALDVLGDVLLAYLERIGKVMSSTVESSGRTSAHANVLDALEAVAMCSAPAVHRLNLPEEDTNEAVAVATPATAEWQTLAQFLFGSNWQQEESTTFQPGTVEEESVALGTGKVAGPGNNGYPSQRSQQAKGWEAPYMEDVPPFPLASETCANPHALPSSVSKSLHQFLTQPADTTSHAEESTAKYLDQIPDHVFQVEWGSASRGDAKPAAKDDQERPRKRVKLDAAGSGGAPVLASRAAAAERAGTRPAYVPSFLPPFPSSLSLSRSILDVVDVESTDIKPTGAVAPSTITSSNKSSVVTDKDVLGVRSSLVKLGQHSYWGSGWDAPVSSATALKVPLGRRTEESAGSTPAVVVPLARPSGTRVSRILEGSMES